MQFLSDSLQLWKDTNFKYTFFIFTVLNGSMNCQVAIIAQLVEPFGFNSVDSSLMGVFVSAFGYISSILFPVVI